MASVAYVPWYELKQRGKIPAGVRTDVAVAAAVREASETPGETIDDHGQGPDDGP